MRRLGALSAILVAVLAALLVWVVWPTHHPAHKATCWGHAYADAHKAPGAPYIRRHGKGPLGVNVCDPHTG